MIVLVITRLNFGLPGGFFHKHFKTFENQRFQENVPADIYTFWTSEVGKSLKKIKIEFRPPQ